MQLDLAEQIISLVIICISFSIIMFDLRIKEADMLWKYVSYGFIIPVVLLSASILMHGKPVATFFAHSADTALVLSLVSLFIVNSENKWFVRLKYVPFILLVLFLFVGFFDSASKYLNAIEIISPAVLATSALVLLVFAGRLIGRKNTFFAALCFLALKGLLDAVGEYDPLCFTLSLSANICFGVFVPAKSLESLQNRVIKAEKKLSQLNRSIEPEIKKRTIEIERVNESLIEASKIDHLSKALTKTAITQEIERLIRVKAPEFSILMFDIDDFKFINDSKGHLTGDKYIHRLSLEARGILRKVDSLGRYGGDEFIAVLPGSSPSQAMLAAERIRKKVEELSSLGFTISIGVASYPHDARTVHELIEFADKGLYESKRKGKNNISRWSGNQTEL
ncbi:MAG: GGDEF domain-containing protein [Clostridiaceae bacterium]|nr:GGDEF domain-containing protein [Clostridiaceae bacterium]